MKTKQSQKKRVLIVDDHPLLRKGIALLIDQQPDLVVCDEVEDGRKVLESVRKTNPDAVILDLTIGHVSGIEVLKDLRVQFPKLPVLVLSMHDEAVYATRALRAGASGYVMKDQGTEVLLGALRKVISGSIHVSDAVSNRMLQNINARNPAGLSPIDCLSDRELEVFTLLGQGLGTRQISEKLHLSIKTIESHRAHIKEKLGLKSAPELVHQAIQWVQTEGRGASPAGNA